MRTPADWNPKLRTLRRINAMLLNEFLEEHCKVEKLDAIIARKQGEALTAGLQKLTAQIETSNSATRVLNN
jgi:hypothetical protein